MATRTPLFLDDAVIAVLLAGDTLDPSTLGAGTPSSSTVLSGTGWVDSSTIVGPDPATGSNQTTQIALETSISAGVGGANDSVVYGNSNGSLSAKLRGLLSLLTGRSVARAPASAAVTSTSQSALAANSSRTGCVMVNLGPGNVSLGDGVTAVANSGITLQPGGTWVMDRYTFTQNAIYAVSNSTATLSIQEYN